MKKRVDKVYTQIVNNCSAAELVPIIKKLASSDLTVYNDVIYNSPANVDYKK